MHLDLVHKTGMLIPICDFFGKKKKRTLRAQLVNFVQVYTLCFTIVHFRDCLVELSSPTYCSVSPLHIYPSSFYTSVFLFSPFLTFTLLFPPFFKMHNIYEFLPLIYKILALYLTERMSVISVSSDLAN